MQSVKIKPGVQYSADSFPLLFQDEDAHDLLARRGCDPSEASTSESSIAGALQMYRQSLALLATSKMYHHCTAFMEQRVSTLMTSADNAELAAALVKDTFKLYLEAHQRGAASVQLYKSWSNLALRCESCMVCLGTAQNCHFIFCKAVAQRRISQIHPTCRRF